MMDLPERDLGDLSAFPTHGDSSQNVQRRNLHDLLINLSMSKEYLNRLSDVITREQFLSMPSRP